MLSQGHYSTPAHRSGSDPGLTPLRAPRVTHCVLQVSESEPGLTPLRAPRIGVRPGSDPPACSAAGFTKEIRHFQSVSASTGNGPPFWTAATPFRSGGCHGTAEAFWQTAWAREALSHLGGTTPTGPSGSPNRCFLLRNSHRAGRRHSRHPRQLPIGGHTSYFFRVHDRRTGRTVAVKAKFSPRDRCA